MVNTTLIIFFTLYFLFYYLLFSYYFHDKVIATSTHTNIMHIDPIFSQCFSFLPPKQITILFLTLNQFCLF